MYVLIEKFNNWLRRASALLVFGLLIWSGLAHAITVNPVEGPIHREIQKDLLGNRVLFGLYLETELCPSSRGISKNIIIICPSPQIVLMSPGSAFFNISDRNINNGGMKYGPSSDIALLDFPIWEIKGHWHFAGKEFAAITYEHFPRGCLAAIFEHQAETICVNWAGNLDVGTGGWWRPALSHNSLPDEDICAQFSFRSSFGVSQSIISDTPQPTSGPPESPREGGDGKTGENANYFVVMLDEFFRLPEKKQKDVLGGALFYVGLIAIGAVIYIVGNK